MDMESIKAFFASLTLERLAPALLVLAVGLLAAKALIKLFEKLLARSKIDKTIHGFLRAAFKILLYSIVVLMILGALNVDTSSLIAILSVTSLAVSLAVQGALSNVAGGIMILTTHPFHVGDWVELGGTAGTIDAIGMSYTTLVTADQKKIFVPNSDLSASRIVNYTMAGRRRVDLTFTASYDDAVEAVKAALLKAAVLPQVHADPPPFVAVSRYGDHAIEYVLRVWTAAADYWDVYYGVTENVKICFDEAGITMTYPHLNVHMESKS
ncbi:MAG: mechanosensitive ion channel family protein [Oscillospiraceae bacterium]|nr:mechanosensitive ion channel family protein [Oscillospiraceae bacterium]